MRPTFFIPLLAAALLGACSTQELQRNVYEGARARDESLRSTPLERSPHPLPAYDTYEKERRGPSAPPG